jgi:acyl-CoA thioesterase I
MERGGMKQQNVFVKICAAIVCLAVLAGCGRGGPKLDKLEPGATILAFGDSLTHGTGAKLEESYPAALERAIGRKVVNAGVPGETSQQGLDRLGSVLEDVKPKLLILCHGGNDFLQKLDEGRASANVRAMIQLARSQGVAVVLMATPKPGLPPSVPTFYADIAKEFGIPFEESVIKSVLFDNSMKSDLVHPNAKGYARMAEALEQKLKKAGAL